MLSIRRKTLCFTDQNRSSPPSTGTRPGPRQVSARVMSPVTTQLPRCVLRRYHDTRIIILFKSQFRQFQPFSTVSRHWVSVFLTLLTRIRTEGSSGQDTANPCRSLRLTSARRHEITGGSVSHSIYHLVGFSKVRAAAAAEGQPSPREVRLCCDRRMPAEYGMGLNSFRI